MQFIKREKKGSDIKQVLNPSEGRDKRWIIFEIIIAVSLSVACWYTYFSMFPNPMNHYVTVAIITILPILMYLACYIPVIGRYIILYVFIIIAIFYLLTYEMVWNGFLVLANIVIEIINNEHTLGLISFEIKGSDTLWQRDATMALLSVFLLISTTISQSVYLKRIILAIIVTALPTCIGLFLKAQPSIWLMLLLIISWLTLYMIAFIKGPVYNRKNEIIYIKQENKSVIPLVFLTTVTVLALAFVLLFSGENYRPYETIDEVKDAVVNFEEKIRYERLGDNRPDGLSQGDLSKSHPLEYIEKSVFTLEMQLPRSMYLRGFVGSSFENGKWKTDEDKFYTGEYKGMTQWLANEGFYAQFQADKVFRMMSDYDMSKVTVTNNSGSSKYVYTPYEVALSGDIVPENLKILRDTVVNSRGIKGVRDYTFTMFLPEFGDFAYEETLDLIDEISYNPEFDQYDVNENIYRRFVFDTYIGNSEEMSALVKEIIPASEIRAAPDGMLFSIRKLFSENYTYDISSDITDGNTIDGETALRRFAFETKAGDDMFFATLATLMLREAGIPARYVEGYYLPPEYVDPFEGMGNFRLEVPDSMAHAWVEIYVEGAGWRPAEVVPGFFSLEKKISEEEEEEIEETKPDESIFYPDEQSIYEEVEEGFNEEQPKNILPFIIIGIILFIILVIEILGRLHVKKVYKSFGRKYSEKQAYATYRHIKSVLAFDGIKLPIDPMDKSSEVGSIYDEHTAIKFDEFMHQLYAVRYGGRKWSREEHKIIGLYTIELSKYIYSKQSLIKKVIMKFVRFLI